MTVLNEFQLFAREFNVRFEALQSTAPVWKERR